jgi:hypothetical protein
MSSLLAQTGSYLSPSEIIVAQEYLTPLHRVRHYTSLCLFCFDEQCDEKFGLPLSLMPDRTVYFDSILFMIIGEKVPYQLLSDFNTHFQKKHF